MPFPFALAALALSGASAIAGASASRKARKSQRRANEAQREQNRLKNFQAKRAFLRNFRQTQAEALMAPIAAGVGLESSLAQSQLQSQGAQARVASEEFLEMDELGGQYAAHMNSAARRQAQAGIYGQIGNFAMSFAAFGSGGSGGTTPPPTLGKGGPPV